MEILNKILNKIKEYNRIIIHGHKRPDGDCYGAQFGLKDIIKSSFPNKEVYVVGETSDFVSFVGTPDIISDDLYEGSLSIVVDTATSERISDLRYTLGKEVIKIDHHIPIDQYGDLIWVDTNFPSCAQMIGFFYRTFKDELKVSSVGARAMYTGIVTDTGRFRYRGVSNLTHEIAGMLIDLGADIEEIDGNLSKETLDQFRFKGHLLNSVKFDEGFVYAIITKADIEKFNMTDEEAAANVNLLGGIEGYNFWFLAIEYDYEIRLRLRASGIEIDKLANMYNGGGHKMAAGAKLKSLDELDGFLASARKYLKEYK
ncbi:DHH family phosphoesterase [Haploplasma modicum]|jgi:bifunctional oligoribonuclease and PAP phosphatase NrnA|uniref:DHH family phosphoesterase n=1 Tax=Haploplasma modicum TaxID=2150 RepID=UPI00214AFB30|nr:bifunctional oligoribonuclease/PAP phosphatase NrnA [Haploplasma modicum]MCR1809346.1 bifunctional oligoribonuclease/PAP phosphatase NrnA [Haploplasma modicum]